MTAIRPDHVRRTLAAIDRHRAALDVSRDRLDRALSFPDRLAALRTIEAALADLGRHVGETRRLTLSAYRANAN